MKNTTAGVYPLQPYQQALLDRVSQGFKHGEMMIFSGGRQTGKSMLNDAFGPMNIPGYPKTTIALKKLMPKYQFSRAKWYSAEMPGRATWRFSDEYNNIIAWCTEQFGAHPERHDAWSRWWVGLRVINFRDEKDLVWYQLRWA